MQRPRVATRVWWPERGWPAPRATMRLARLVLLGCLACAAAEVVEEAPEEWIESYDKASNKK